MDKGRPGKNGNGETEENGKRKARNGKNGS